MTHVAELNAVTKWYGDVEALSGIDLAVGAGEAVALLGPNGAGKSTAVNILLGLRKPTSGTARLFGLPSTAPEARRRVGATPQEIDFPPNLKGRELINFVRGHYANPFELDDIVERFDLADIVERQATALSGGQRRRLALAMAFAGPGQSDLGTDADAAFW